MLKKFMVVLYLAVFVLSAGLVQANTGAVAPAAALQMLKDGNARFLAGPPLANLNANSTSVIREEIAQAQAPFAIVLDCSDSRLTPEIIFDQGLGQLFVVRVAGNVIAPHQIASIEYAIEHLGAKLVVIMGHERCGAVSAAYGSFNANGTTTTAYSALTKDLKELVNAIKQPVIDTKNSTNSVTDCILNNTHKVTTDLKANSEVIAGILNNVDPLIREELGVIEAFYDLDDGVVTFTTDFAGTPSGDVFFTVKASAVGSGVITPSGDSAVHGKGSQKFFIMPSAGFSIVSVTDKNLSTSVTTDVTGVLVATGVGATKSYDLTGVNENHTITATFTAPLTPAVAPAWLSVPANITSASKMYVISAPSSTTGATYQFQYRLQPAGTWVTYDSGTVRNPTISLPGPGTYDFQVFVKAGGYADSPVKIGNSVTVSSAVLDPAYLNIQSYNATSGVVYLIAAPSATPGALYNFEYTTDGSTWVPFVTGSAVRNPYFTLPGTGTYRFRVYATSSIGGYVASGIYTTTSGTVTK